VEIGVSDTGVGIPPQVLEHIFEPFFTTKAPGEGTGLGLAAVYGTIKDHNGCLTVQTEMGRGTIFKLYLPATKEPMPEADSEESDLQQGQGRILLVDDEEVVRATAMAILERSGYDVTPAYNGLDAWQKFERAEGAFDLVVLDLVMPVMSGHDAFRRMRAYRPDTRILLASGFSLGGDVEELMREGAVGFVQKPYRLNMLARAVTEALAGREVTITLDRLDS
jgi:CheY-like chemotaxis protein